MNELVFEALKPFLYGAIAVCLYAFLIRRLSDFVHPVRLALAAVGEQTLAMDIHEDDRNAINLMLDNAFNPLSAVVVALLILFFIPASLLFKKQPDKASQAFKENRTKIAGLFLVSAFAANPVFAIIALNEALFVGILFLLLGRSRHILRDCVALIQAETKAMTTVSSLTWHGRSA
jgi:hypothetical protein